jgi:hypothetical protein
MCGRFIPLRCGSSLKSQYRSVSQIARYARGNIALAAEKQRKSAKIAASLCNRTAPLFFVFDRTVVDWFNLNSNARGNMVLLGKSGTRATRIRQKTAVLRGWLVLTSQGSQVQSLPRPPFSSFGNH